MRSSHLVHCMACCVLSVPCALAACCGTGRMLMLHLVRGVRVCRVAHWLSHTVLRACCWVCAVRCSPHTKYGSAACCLLHLACARVLLYVVCCLLHVVCCMLPVARCRLIAVCWAMSAVCCMPVACCLLPFCALSVARRLLSFPRCRLHADVARCPLSVAWYLLRCISFVVRCTLHEVWRMLPAARCALHVACCILPAAWRMVSGRCVLHAAWRRLRFHCVRCTLRAASRLLLVASFTFACRMLSLIRCLSHLLCCMSSSCRATQRRRTRSASRQRSQLRPR